MNDAPNTPIQALARARAHAPASNEFPEALTRPMSEPFTGGVRAVAVSTVLAVAARGRRRTDRRRPIAFAGFKNPLNSFAISAVIGITAGLSIADDTGRRYLIGVAAAVQLAIFPVWLGPLLFWACSIYAILPTVA